MERVNDSFSSRLIIFISIFRFVGFVDTRKRLHLIFGKFKTFLKERMKL